MRNKTVLCIRASLIGALALFIGLPGTAIAQAADAPQGGARSPDLNRAAEQIVAGTNAFRKKHGRGELHVNAELTKAAQSFADFMARTDKYSHTADGQEPWQRAAKAGYAYCIVDENIAYVFSSEGFSAQQLAQGLLTAWKNSPEHRKNLLDPDIDDIGVGVAHSASTGRYYAVQDFGRPKAKAITFQVTNRSDATVRYTVDGKEFTLEPRYTRTHESCRPSVLAASAAEATDHSKETFRPAKGDRFVFRADAAGAIVLVKERGQPARR